MPIATSEYDKLITVDWYVIFQNAFCSLLIPLHSRTGRSPSAHAFGNQDGKMLLTSEKKGRGKKVFRFPRGERERKRAAFKGEFIGDISRPDDVGIAQCRLLSIPINHWRTTARTRINTRTEDTCREFLMPRRDRHMWPQSDVLMAIAYWPITCATRV